MVVKGYYGKGVEKTDGGKGGVEGYHRVSLVTTLGVLTSLTYACLTSMFGVNRRTGWPWPVMGVVVLAICVSGSEFPERECCDPVYPPNTATTAAAPVTHPVSKPGQTGEWNLRWLEKAATIKNHSIHLSNFSK